MLRKWLQWRRERRERRETERDVRRARAAIELMLSIDSCSLPAEAEKDWLHPPQNPPEAFYLESISKKRGDASEAHDDRA